MHCILIFGCGNKKEIEKHFLLNITNYNKVSFRGSAGDKVNFRIRGKFRGSINFEMIGSRIFLTKGDFKIYKDSINLNIDQAKIYQDGTGFDWYVRPVSAPNGKVLISITEYRN